VEVCDEYLFGRAKTDLGLVTNKKQTKKNTKEKMGITRHHPDGEVIPSDEKDVRPSHQFKHCVIHTPACVSRDVKYAGFVKR